MKREKIKDAMGFQISIIPWILVYPFIGYLIRWKVKDIFLYLSEESAVSRSIEEYLHSVNITLIFAAILSLFWWGFACNTTNLRKVFEENTILFGAVFIIILTVAIMVGPSNMVIVDDMENDYRLLTEWCVLGGFTFNLFLFSPQNVRRVVFFKGGLGSGLMAVLSVVLSTFCLWKGVM